MKFPIITKVFGLLNSFCDCICSFSPRSNNKTTHCLYKISLCKSNFVKIIFPFQVYTPSELPPLSRIHTIFDDGVTFKTRLNQKSKLKEMCKVLVQGLSNDTTLKGFMESCFGHFIKMSQYWQLSAQLIHYLLLRRIKCEKKQELWFLIDGKPARFGLQEFVMVTGLNCCEKRLKTIYLEDLIQSDNTTEDDRLKNSLVYVLCQVLFPADEKRNVPREWLAYANDLSFFNSYPWGRECYEVTIKGLQIDLRPKLEMYLASEGKEVKISYTIFGFLWALQVRLIYFSLNICVVLS
ncbi:hypothetical protein UlMin_001298 [Ulmus minor]